MYYLKMSFRIVCIITILWRVGGFIKVLSMKKYWEKEFKKTTDSKYGGEIMGALAEIKTAWYILALHIIVIAYLIIY